MISISVFLSRPSRLFAAATTALVAVLTLGLSQAAMGQASALHADLTTSGAPGTISSAAHAESFDPAAMLYWDASKKQSEEGNAGAMHEGMKMHGHWIIDVKNSDGTLAHHHDFQNALENSAQGYLIGLLAGYYTPGDYMIIMGAQAGNSPCLATFQFCGIVRSLATYPGIAYCGSYYCSTGLTYTYNLVSPYSMVLAGSITANQTGTIGTVFTAYNSCANVAFPAVPTSTATTSPTACITNTTGTRYGPLSDVTIAPIPVTNGQIIQVTVTITFS